ncbi:MAG: transcription-repair coupling factor [Anaerovoracaceae bacterium]|jgi:transcription-repair coupling factor (superfamily II helicase)
MNSGVKALADAAVKKSASVCASGICRGQTAYACAEIMKTKKGQILIIVPSAERAVEMKDYLSFFSPDSAVYVFPEEERHAFHYDAMSKSNSFGRIECLNEMLSGRDGFFVAPVMAASKGMEPKEKFLEHEIRIARGEETKDDLRKLLAEAGYERCSMTEAPGQFSVRGEIIDVFPTGSDCPYRIDMFDVEVDEIKQFDPFSQRSVRKLESLVIPPAAIGSPEDGEKASYIWDYMKKGSLVCADDWNRITEARVLADKEWAAAAAGLASADGEESSDDGEADEEIEKEVFLDLDDLPRRLKKNGRLIITEPLDTGLKDTGVVTEEVRISCIQASSYNGQMKLFGDDLRRLAGDGYEVHVACSTAERAANLREFAERSEITGNIVFDEGYLPEGVIFSDDKIAYISDSDVFRNARKKRRKKKKSSSRMAAFADFNEGDYVVHENRGIGVFEGIKPLVVDDIRRDYMMIKYAGGDMLYVPVEQMDLVQPYIGSGGAAPKISRLGTSEWTKTKARARAAVENMAEELVELSAQRKMEPGFQFSPDTVWQRQFEDQFPYEETEDQLRCIEEIKLDMESPWPMDRLLCGDVGFGKTEVAARAIFKCVMDGKQAAVLVPTTILANQHYETFKERFSKFPCNIDMLSRFRTDAEQKKTLKDLEEGRIDVLVGTHRMLSADVKFKDLGLLVIDEEQRFGVQHKEAIKQMKKNVDVLSLSATPIPRTLHMSLSGIRSMSTIEEAPEDRFPVQTYVLEEDDSLIRSIIMRELDRDGQCFVIYNRVRGINMVTDKIRTLVPEARVASAHGRMDERKLEDVMNSFINREYDVLVATTIVESGIDIPSANTLIVLDSDRYGLAQLYQLRGRVGRSDVAAYAYFMYQKNKVLSEVAERRLKAIREFTEFGSGFRIAMKDLEIRGAGNLLGTEQSGHMMTIGYELYCKMIDDAVRRLKGETVQEEEKEVTVDISTDAFISSDYISDENVKLDMYKHIAGIRDEDDVKDVREELADRFGDVPKETESLMKVALIKSKCLSAGIVRVAYFGGRLTFTFDSDNAPDPVIFENISKAYGNAAIINMGKKPFVKIQVKRVSDVIDSALDFLGKAVS